MLKTEKKNKENIKDNRMILIYLLTQCLLKIVNQTFTLLYTNVIISNDLSEYKF